jgi:hypothetical protein
LKLDLLGNKIKNKTVAESEDKMLNDERILKQEKG